MSAVVACFWTQPTDEVRRSLRRFAYSHLAGFCPSGGGVHEALSPLDSIEHPSSSPMTIRDGSDAFPDDDPRWPTSCACGFAFRPEDSRQLWLDRVYERVDVVPPLRATLAEMPAGAMYDADYFKDDSGDCVGPDGISLMVKLPNGEWWFLDGEPRWTRSGVVPKITASPSVDCRPSRAPAWHGFLRAGLLEPC